MTFEIMQYMDDTGMSFEDAFEAVADEYGLDDIERAYWSNCAW